MGKNQRTLKIFGLKIISHKSFTPTLTHLLSHPLIYILILILFHHCCVVDSNFIHFWIDVLKFILTSSFVHDECARAVFDALPGCYKSISNYMYIDSVN